MTAQELKDVLVSSHFTQELGERSSYLASIMQERPIVYLLAKHLWKRGAKVALEEKRYDLCVNGKTRVEFKFMYIRGVEALQKELKKWDNLERMWAAVQAGEKSRTWGVMPRIYQDVCCDKRADLFVWIICSRDLDNVPDDGLEQICLGRQQGKFNKTYPYKSHRDLLTTVDEFLELLSAKRPFSVVKDEIVTSGDFPSTYHLRICEFNN